MEGLDQALFEKLTVVEGDMTPLFQENANSIAMVVYTDDDGNVSHPDFYPPLDSLQIITYIDEAGYFDSRTGEPSTGDTPEEFMEYRITASHDVEYTICAYVTVPHSMSYRYSTTGYSFVLPGERLEADSGQEILPLFYLFDAPDAAASEHAEDYLAELTGDEASGLMYESKATLRAEFEGFQSMFLLLGSLLCALIGLVGILNFFNAIMTGILSRKREFAVLQAVGMTNRQLKTMLIDEGLFYAGSSAVAALGLSAVFHPLMGSLLENLFWFFRARFTILPALAAIPAFALLGWVIPSVMYGQGMKHSIVERLRDKE